MQMAEPLLLVVARVLLLDRDLKSFALEIKRLLLDAGWLEAVAAAAATTSPVAAGPPPEAVAASPPPRLPLGEARKWAAPLELAPAPPDTLPLDPYNGNTLEDDFDFCMTGKKGDMSYHYRWEMRSGPWRKVMRLK